ncbi:lysis system i-spanin subunit Rz [Pseudomonas entomophila]|uniref:lysis system i-spanin subunit Rz n=1 Tax=Pseudomonas entomophila TaxID=312306 RepID=UPI001F005483|nr:lysis system i-spanin subunit Rz [Pseudomonas entomophila]MCG8292235.1 lysis protein [Pseudomonas entomophila]
MAWRIVGCALLLGVVLGGYGQAWRYGRLLAEQEQQLVQQRLEQAEALHGLLLSEREQRQGLEQRLKDTTQQHWKELTDAQQAQARLRDRLATADLRLSVLVDAGTVAASGGDGGVRTPAGTRGLVDGAVRAQLDPAHARRIVAITDEGDRAVIALQACQAYVREVTR